MPEIKNIINLLINLRYLQSTTNATINPSQSEINPSTDNVEADDELIGSIPTGNIPSVDDSSSFLWLLIFDLLIFVFLSFRAYQGALKIEENIKDTEDPNYTNKLKFMKGLTYSNGSIY